MKVKKEGEGEERTKEKGAMVYTLPSAAQCVGLNHVCSTLWRHNHKTTQSVITPAGVIHVLIYL